jgi:uncharacterized protein involved in outer membrane biogenesis
MTDEAQGRHRTRTRLAMAVAVLAVLLTVIIVPPLVSVGRYKGRITSLISSSLGRPVRLSSVELRLLPRPGFVLTDLTVDEDPAYGAEPVLHANTVTVSIRLLSLWRGLEISRISVDEASLNLVRTPAGRWNVESLFRTAAQPAAGNLSPRRRRQVPLPYLEATDSRINVKNGAEKLPFSLINSDLSFWQDQPGEWRIRLRGQPARTDLSLDLADTGVVRLDADLHRAAELRQVPMHVDLEWSEAQLGQLTRLVVGSDSGWRGDLTGEFHLDGTPDAAQIKTRLRAAGVHRAEFAPEAPMDFDATCGFVYHYSSRAVEGLDCYSPLGDGRIHLTGDLPGDSTMPRFSIELNRLPVAAALDALRTVRSGFEPGLEAAGTVSGKVSYAESPPAILPIHAHAGKARSAKSHPPAQGLLAGSFTVQGFELTGEGLSQPIRINKVVLEPSVAPSEQTSVPFQGLIATASIPSGESAPLTVTSRLALTGYEVTVRGQASITRLSELAQIAGLGNLPALNALTGDPATVDLSAEGPWLAREVIPVESAAAPPQPGPDRLSGTLTLHHATWKADFLANPIQISQATLHVDNGLNRWDPVEFTYGPVKGTASLSLVSRCDVPQGCPPVFQLQFGALDAGSLELAILGAQRPGTLLSELIARLSPSRAPAWPRLDGAIKADSLVLGPVTLEKPSATVRILADGAEITALDAGLFGGHIEGTGTVHASGTQEAAAGKPEYALDGQFEHLKPAAIGQLLGQRWTGGEIEGNGKIDLSGYADKDFAASANGSLHFEWRRGSVAPAPAADEAAVPDPVAAAISQALARFDDWTTDAVIANGAITLKESQVQRGPRRSTVSATVEFDAQPRMTFVRPKEVEAAKR